MLRDYDTKSVMGSVVLYTLVPFYNHSRVNYKRKYRASLSCPEWFGHIIGWIYIKTGFYLYD